MDHHPAQDHEKVRTIVVAIDEGDHSIYALTWALDVLLIGHLLTDRIVLLYAKPSHASLSGPAFVLTTDAIESLERYDQHVITEITASVKQICSQRNVNAEMKVLTGDPRDAITETIDKLKADFLVMGSHGFGPIKRYTFSS